MADAGIRGMDRLLTLQEQDLAIDRLEHRRADLEEGDEVRQARARMEALEEQVGTLKLAIDSVEREQMRLEHEGDSFTQKIVAEERRLYDGSVANPKELQSIRAEVENLKVRRSRTEDELLGQMEKVEELGSRLGPLEAELAEASDRLAEVAGSSAAELRDIGEALVSRRSERDAVARELDEDLLELYDDLRAQKKRVGAAALVDRVCQACRQQLSPLEYEQVRADDGIRRCPNCRRILVFE